MERALIAHNTRSRYNCRGCLYVRQLVSHSKISSSIRAIRPQLSLLFPCPIYFLSNWSGATYIQTYRQTDRQTAAQVWTCHINIPICVSVNANIAKRDVCLSVCPCKSSNIQSMQEQNNLKTDMQLSLLSFKNPAGKIICKNARKNDGAIRTTSGAAAYQLGNTSSRTITEVKQR